MLLHHGYHVTVFSEVASNYLRGWLIPDALSAVPIDLIAAAATRATEPDWNTAVYLLRPCASCASADYYERWRSYPRRMLCSSSV